MRPAIADLAPRTPSLVVARRLRYRPGPTFSTRSSTVTRALHLSAVTLALAALAACSNPTPPAAPPAQKAPPAPVAAPPTLNQDNNMASAIPQGTGDLYAIFQTSAGDIVVKLFEKDAPKTVENFVALATGAKEWIDPRTGQKTKARLYDGTNFHRVIPQFMIQGGDPLGTGTGGPGYRFEDEFQSGKTFNKPGILAMANAGPGTNGSQFFITEVPTPHLNNRHTIFGEVTRGFELVPQIARAGNAATKLNHVEIKRSATAP
ncbi:MAG: peptidylprolyl isomerase [Deltaproteobacteria bacterium]|nr:peptidylprolyl isomerase [Deltaproteobacteria bacterium]